MKDVSLIKPYRISHPELGYGDDSEGICRLTIVGAPEAPRLIPPNLVYANDRKTYAIFSKNEGWEHVSVTIAGLSRCPTWAEMCLVKDVFWDETEAVMQLHPPKADWVNCHPTCLHLWKPVGLEIPRPPKELVGGA